MPTASISGRVSCLGSCPLNQTGKDFQELLHTPEETGVIGFITTPKAKLTSQLRFAPVGNFVTDPLIIVCGKTPDQDTQSNFWAQCKSTRSPEAAAQTWIFSNPKTRNNLFLLLSEIDIFELLRKAGLPDWKECSNSEVWQRLFDHSFQQSNLGIQLTQACNCAIINLTGKRGPSAQPTASTVNALTIQNPRCLFNSFCIPNSAEEIRLSRLRLIVFLDTPNKKGGQFHLDHFFQKSEIGRACYEAGVRVISVPHPSGSNRIYNGSLKDHPAVIAAKKTIEEIMTEL